MPHINIPATTALETLHPGKGQTLGLLTGANVLMPSFTISHNRKKYSIYDNKVQIDAESAKKTIRSVNLSY